MLCTCIQRGIATVVDFDACEPDLHALDVSRLPHVLVIRKRRYWRRVPLNIAFCYISLRIRPHPKPGTLNPQLNALPNQNKETQPNPTHTPPTSTSPQAASHSIAHCASSSTHDHTAAIRHLQTAEMCTDAPSWCIACCCCCLCAPHLSDSVTGSCCCPCCTVTAAAACACGGCSTL